MVYGVSGNTNCGFVLEFLFEIEIIIYLFGLFLMGLLFNII
jgi:hypothetical protein